MLLIIFLTTNINPSISGNIISPHNYDSSNERNPILTIDHLSTNRAYPGDSIIIYGMGFGSDVGYVVLTGLKIPADSWSNTEIEFTVPENGASGPLYVRDSMNGKSNSVLLTVERILPTGQFEPYGFQLEDVGLAGAAFLVETDGSYFYGVTGFETLCTYEILGNGSYDLCSRIYLPQRVGDIKIFNGYLFISGDHGLVVYRCSDLQNDTAEVIAAIAGGSFITLDLKQKDGNPITGTLLALCEYLPIWGTNILRTPLFRFESEELEFLGCYTKIVDSLERYHAIAIDPLNPKLYVSGLRTLLGNDRYILELDISDVENIHLNYQMETGGILAFDMDARDDTLWTGIVQTGTVRFQVYDLHPGTAHLNVAQTITGAFRIGRATRVKIIDDTITVGCSWSGERPDVYLLKTFNSGTQPLATANTIDWAFDITGYSLPTDANQGKIIIADEWGGFLTYDYTNTPSYMISHVQNYHWVVSGAMTQEIYLTDTRLFVADRGAGVWSADRYDLSDESSWKWVDWDWIETEPQPHPISALCTREDTTYGTLIAALGHNKAMAWGEEVYGILYKETEEDIEFLAISDAVNPPGLYSTGISVIWPEPDLVYMVTGTDGFRAYIINPDEPSIGLHTDCVTQGFGTDSFSTTNIANCMVFYNQQILIGSKPGVFSSDSSLHIYNVIYPEGVPDRNNPGRHIMIELDTELKCLKHITVNHIDITPSGLIALATSKGIAVFHLSWISELNTMTDAQAWNLIKIPDETYYPWWKSTWTSFQADARFSDDSSIYVVKNPEGLWKIDVDIDYDGYTHNSKPAGFYPGVQCGINYSELLYGWQNPDIITLHHPYGLVVDTPDIYVHGWSGKVNTFSFTVANTPPSDPNIDGPANGNKGTKYDYTFSSTDPEGQPLLYFIDWGDGTTEQWIGPFNSGQPVTVGHIWEKKGTYQIKAKTMDEDSGVSYWGEYEVTMPKNNIFSFGLLCMQLLEQIFERFPLVFPILRHLMGY